MENTQLFQKISDGWLNIPNPTREAIEAAAAEINKMVTIPLSDIENCVLCVQRHQKDGRGYGFTQAIPTDKRLNWRKRQSTVRFGINPVDGSVTLMVKNLN